MSQTRMQEPENTLSEIEQHRMHLLAEALFGNDTPGGADGGNSGNGNDK